jgi:predicted glycogen debranching enzyme
MSTHDILISHPESPATWRDKEWLITNGLGGYASGTLSGNISRRYHGLFVPNLSNPKGRHLMISRYVEEIVANGVVATIGDSITSPDSDSAFRVLRSFRLQGNTAHWRYQIGETAIERSVLMPHTQNTVCVRYRIISGGSVVLRLRPFVAFRRQDAPLIREQSSFAVTLVANRCEIALDGVPLRLRLAVRPTAAIFVAEAMDVENSLLREQRRGHEHLEMSHSPGYFKCELRQDVPLSFIATTHGAERLDFDVDAAFEAEEQRLHAVHAVSADADANDEFAGRLKKAADQFLVLPASRIEDAIVANAGGHELRTVFAGYHWFADWGRDTMISLEGLMLCTRRFREARATLQTFAGYVADGLLPNLFPEGERVGLYHTVDATLWYFHALNRYLRATGDTALLMDLLPTLESVIEHHVIGTKFGIHVDPADGLISAGEEGCQLTWMDAKCDGWVVTPRRGKPVEIQALWYNALRLMQTWTRSAERRDAYERGAAKAYESFNSRFWNSRKNCLLDVIDGPEGNDERLRPNQMFSISLDNPVLDRNRWNAVIETVNRELVTPFGLRTLSRDDIDYKRTYHGDLRSRDAAYHQGTVWPWLIGHFIDAWLKAGNGKPAAREMLNAFDGHLLEGGIGSISEIFDAEPPHAPHGCIAQAWSIAEVLRAWLATR